MYEIQVSNSETNVYPDTFLNKPEGYQNTNYF